MAISPAQKKGRLEKEIGKYRRAIEEDSSCRMYAPLADALRRNGELPSAISVAEEGVKRHPRYLTGIVVLAQLLQTDGQNNDRALELFGQVVRMSPENIAAQKGLAEIYDRQGNHAKALNAYHALTLLDPSDKKSRDRLALLEATAPRTSARTIFGGTPAPEEKAPPAPPETSTVSSEAPCPEGPPVETKEAPAEETTPPGPEIQAEAAPAPTPASGSSSAESKAPELPPRSELIPGPAPEMPPPSAETKAQDAGEGNEDGEKTVELPRPSEASAPPPTEWTGDEDSVTMPLPMPEESLGPAVVSKDAGEEPGPAATAPEESPPPPSSVPESPGPAGPSLDLRTMNEGQKLDLFFAGADFSEDMADQTSGKPAPAAPAKEEEQEEAAWQIGTGTGMTGDPETRMIRARFARYFWEAGSFDRALVLIGEEVLDAPEDRKLRGEFENMCKFRNRDPEVLLSRLREFGKTGKTVERPGGARPPAGATVKDSAKPLGTPAEAAKPAPAGAGKTDAPRTRPAPAQPPEPKAAPETEVPGPERIQALRGYLEKIRKEKENKP